MQVFNDSVATAVATITDAESLKELNYMHRAHAMHSLLRLDK